MAKGKVVLLPFPFDDLSFCNPITSCMGALAPGRRFVMSYVMVDVETDRPSPADYSMIRFGAVVVEPSLTKTLYGQLPPGSNTSVCRPNFELLSKTEGCIFRPSVQQSRL